MYKIYHNSRCKISRQVLDRLKETGDEIVIIDYINKKLTPIELSKLLNELHLKPDDLIRKNEILYKTEYKNKNFSPDEWIRILCKNPKLIERPIVLKGYNAIICRPPERIEEFINGKTFNYDF